MKRGRPGRKPTEKPRERPRERAKGRSQGRKKRGNATGKRAPLFEAALERPGELHGALTRPAGFEERGAHGRELHVDAEGALAGAVREGHHLRRLTEKKKRKIIFAYCLRLGGMDGSSTGIW